MAKKWQKSIISLLILLVMAVFLTDTSKYISSVSTGLSVWATSVLPALFPFILLSKLFISVDAFSTHFNKDRFFQKTMRCQPAGSYTALLSLLCGYPVGAKIISEQYKNNFITQTQATKLATFCSTAGPVFLIGTVGAKMLNSTLAGVVILISTILGNFATGLMYRNSFVDNTVLPQTQKHSDKTFSLGEAILDSVNSVMIVGGLIAIFFMLTDMLYLVLPSWCQTEGQLITGYLLGLLEMTNGCLIISTSTDLFTATILCCALVSFGGLCILLQTMTFYSKCNIKTRTVLTLKVSHCACSTIICFLICLALRYFNLL